MKGFTLIELVMVIVILGIVAATIIPTINAKKERTVDEEANVLTEEMLVN